VRRWYDRWFEPEQPGPGTLAEHVLTTGCGSWWTDDLHTPHVVLLRSGSQRVLRGDPRRLPTAWLPLLARGQVSAPSCFAPLLAREFPTFTPWRRTVLVHWDPPAVSRLRSCSAYRLERLQLSEEPSLAAADPALHWIWETWGSPGALARSGCAWGTWRGDVLVAVACTYLRGRDREDVAVVTAPSHRRQGLAAMLTARLTVDIRARGRDATWTAPTSNTASLALAAKMGFRSVRTETAYWVGGWADRSCHAQAAA
jgi:GNAT superfamily N-acetyltransferase